MNRCLFRFRGMEYQVFWEEEGEESVDKMNFLIIFEINSSQFVILYSLCILFEFEIFQFSNIYIYMYTIIKAIERFCHFNFQFYSRCLERGSEI